MQRLRFSLKKHSEFEKLDLWNEKLASSPVETYYRIAGATSLTVCKWCELRDLIIASTEISPICEFQTFDQST